MIYVYSDDANVSIVLSNGIPGAIFVNKSKLSFGGYLVPLSLLHTTHRSAKQKLRPKASNTRYEPMSSK